jgi:hypothetical protein
MKRYLIFVFSVLFGLAQMAQAANPDDAKKGKKAPQAVGKAQKHVGQPPAAFKKSSNVSSRVVGAPAYHQVNQHVGKPPAAFKKSSNVSSRVVGAPTYHQVNQHVGKPPTAFKKSANFQRRVVQTPAYNQVNTNQVNPKFQKKLQKDQRNVNNYNAAVATQQAARNQNYNAAVAAQQATRNQNNAAIAAQNAQRWNNQNVNRGNWNGLSFSDAYRRRHRGYHDRNWWSSRYGTNFILFGGGYYYQDSGYWYPAYGYDRAYSSYEYDGPIYGYNNLPPGEVVTNVQSALQQQGYYRGEIDGSIGPITRAALRRYQRDNGLEITAAIDRPTLASLGLT